MPSSPGAVGARRRPTSARTPGRRTPRSSSRPSAVVGERRLVGDEVGVGVGSEHVEPETRPRIVSRSTSGNATPWPLIGLRPAGQPGSSWSLRDERVRCSATPAWNGLRLSGCGPAHHVPLPSRRTSPDLTSRTRIPRSGSPITTSASPSCSVPRSRDSQRTFGRTATDSGSTARSRSTTSCSAISPFVVIEATSSRGRSRLGEPRSMVSCRALRVSAMAASASRPASRSRHATIVPVRPRPPRQATTTRWPAASRASTSSSTTRRASRSPVTSMSRIGNRMRSMPVASMTSAILVTRAASSSWSSTSSRNASTRCSPASRFASVSRSRQCIPVQPSRCLPSRNVMPSRPPNCGTSSAGTQSTRNGLPVDVLQPAPSSSASTSGTTTSRPRIPSSHSSGIPSMPQ